jgi:hypothetical protein
MKLNEPLIMFPSFEVLNGLKLTGDIQFLCSQKFSASYVYLTSPSLQLIHGADVIGIAKVSNYKDTLTGYLNVDLGQDLLRMLHSSWG